MHTEECHAVDIVYSAKFKFRLIGLLVSLQIIRRRKALKPILVSYGRKPASGYQLVRYYFSHNVLVYRKGQVQIGHITLPTKQIVNNRQKFSLHGLSTTLTS
jgi:hypothetical protein